MSNVNESPDTVLAEILNPLVSGYRRGGGMSLVAAVRAAGWRPAAERADECGHPWCGADGGACPDCDFDVTRETR